MQKTVIRNCVPIGVIAMLFLIAGWFIKTKIDNIKEEISQQSEQVVEFSSPQSTRDCRSWTPLEYTTVKNDIGKEIVIKNDADDHRLDIWSKHFDKWSGPGSTLLASKNFRVGMTKIIEFLKADLKKDKISILDSSCGDMVWMPTFLRGRTDVEYTGYDLLPVNVETAREKFRNETWKFETFDLVKDRIKNQFDLLINRHTAIHLGLHDNIQMFHNFYQSGSKYLLTTTYPLQTRNTQLFLSGKPGFHEINLALPPFQLPVPICQAPDDPNSGNGGQFFALWVMNSLDSFDGRNVDLIRPYKP